MVNECEELEGKGGGKEKREEDKIEEEGSEESEKEFAVDGKGEETENGRFGEQLRGGAFTVSNFYSIPLGGEELMNSKPPTSLQLRRRLFTEATEFSRSTTDNLYALLMSVTHPTDPTSLVSSPDYDLHWRLPPHPDQPVRGRWFSLSSLFFILVCDAMYTCLTGTPVAVQAKGGSLYIMSGVLWFVVGVPLLQFQHLLIQFMQSGPLRAFSFVGPRAGGVGISVILLAFVRSCTTLRHLAETLLYLYTSLQSPSPWGLSETERIACMEYTDHDSCTAHLGCVDYDVNRNGTCYANPLYQSVRFFNTHLRGPFPIRRIGINYEIAVFVILSVIIATSISILALRLISQLATFTVICTTFILIYVGVGISIKTGGVRSMLLFFEETDLRDFLSLRSWLAASIVVARLGFFAFGVQTVVTSYTRQIIFVTVHRIGEQIHLIAHHVAIIYLVLSVFSVLLFYSMEGLLFAQTRLGELSAIHKGTSVSFLKTLVRVELHQPIFRKRTEEFLARASYKSLLFVVHPWGFTHLKAPIMTTVIFYFCLFLMGLVSFSCTSLAVVFSVQENIRHSKTPYSRIVVIASICILIMSIPMLVVYPVGKGLITGRDILLNSAESFGHYGTSIISVSQIVASCCAFAVERDRNSLTRRNFVFVSLYTGVVITIAASQFTRGWIAFVLPALVAAVFFICIPILLAKVGSNSPFKNDVRGLLIGDVEEIRQTFNGVIVAYNQSTFGRKLPYAWSWLFKYAAFIVFSSIIPSIPMANIQLTPPTRSDLIRRIVSDTLYIIIVSIPIVLVALFPQIIVSILPPPEERWSFRKISCRRRNKVTAYRRPKKRFWEEFQDSSSIWMKASQLEKRTVHL